ncbi:MAG: DUF305 domain-containing protein [Candidatus Paceibacterota bacterium]|jgi:uncharacterized protein (DUF305 family)
MKKIIESYNVKSLIVGGIFGAFISMFIFSALVPSGPEMIRAYNMKRYRNMMDDTVNINQMGGPNSYFSGEITSEKEFVEDMVKHHNAAVFMSQKVLKLSPREAIKKLAEDIINTQTSEIKMMNDLLNNWK